MLEPKRAERKEPARKPNQPAAATAPVQLNPTGVGLAFELATRTPGPEHEKEADAAADAVVRGQGGAGTADRGTPYGVIVEDTESPGPGQIRRSEFMQQLSSEIERVATEELAPSGRTAHDCPYLTHYLDYYRQADALHLERAIQRYSPPSHSTVESIETAVLGRVRSAVRHWMERGTADASVFGLEASLGLSAPTGQGTDGTSGFGLQATVRLSSPTWFQAKAQGSQPAAGNPAAIRSQLGGGRPLDGAVRSRMESGFGSSFDQVRLHTDPAAARLASSYSARAFTIGSDIAFGAGQYRPGTLEGDILIAHELAHTIQQRGALEAESAAEGYEADATQATMGALLPETNLKPRPRLMSGLSLRRCGSEEPAATGIQTEYAPTIDELKKLYARRAELAKAVPGQTDDQKKEQTTQQAQVEQRIRELTEIVWSWGIQLTDKQLQTAIESGQDLHTKVGQPFSPDAAEATTAGTPGSTAAPPKDLEIPDLSGIKFNTTPADSRVLLIWSKKDLYALPAQGLVYTAEAPPARPGQVAPTGPVFGVPTAGHAGAYLVKTDQGLGMMVDAGGKTTGRPQVLMPASLEYLQVRMNIGEIDGALLSHTHADHLANVPMLVEQEQLTGAIYVWPGWEGATKGPMAKVWRQLQDPSFTQYGKGPSWQPTQVTARQIAGPAGKTGVTQGTLTIGGVQMDFVTSTDKLQRYVDALKAGEKGTEFADSASKLVRITPIGGKFNILIVGDLRGADIKELNAQMTDSVFRDFVKDTRVFGGMQHHLGAVNSKADVEGIRILLKAIGPTAEPLTVAVQTGDAKNQDLIDALTKAGVRVVTLGEIDPAKTDKVIDPANPGKVTFTAKGELRSDRASVFEADPTIRAAEERVVNLTRAAEALEKYPDEMMGIGKTPAEIAAGLRSEVVRLRAAVEARQDLATSKLHPDTAIADVEDQLQRNEQQLKQVAGMEADLGEQVQVLSRFRTRAEEIRTERERSRQRGESSLRLRQLIAEVQPKLAEEILAEQLGQAGLSRRSERRARRAARARLKEQGRLSQLAEPGAPRFAGIGTARGGVAVVLIAMEIVDLAEPFVSQYVQGKQEAKYNDFYTFLQVAAWWQDHGASVPVVGLRGDKTETVDAKDLLNTVKKRIWTDLPKERQTPEADLDAEVKSAVPLEKLYVPQIFLWKNAQFVWDSFRNFVSSNVKNYDDYASEFNDTENPAIRLDPTHKSSFEDTLWEVRTGKVEGDHITDGWQFSPELTVIMRQTAVRVIQGTEEKIEKEKARQGTTFTQGQEVLSAATASSDEEPNIGQPSSAVTGIGHFKPGASRRVHGNYRFKEADPSPLWRKEDQPEFLVYESERAPHEGYVLIGAGDYNTYNWMRRVKVWTYDSEQSVKLPKDTTKPYELTPTEPVRTPREQYAEDAKHRGEGEFIPREGTIYYGEMRFPYWRPNESTLLWVRKDDLDIQPFSPTKPQTK